MRLYSARKILAGLAVKARQVVVRPAVMVRVMAMRAVAKAVVKEVVEKRDLRVGEDPILEAETTEEGKARAAAEKVSRAPGHLLPGTVLNGPEVQEERSTFCVSTSEREKDVPTDRSALTPTEKRISRILVRIGHME